MIPHPSHGFPHKTPGGRNLPGSLPLVTQIIRSLTIVVRTHEWQSKILNFVHIVGRSTGTESGGTSRFDWNHPLKFYHHHFEQKILWCHVYINERFFNKGLYSHNHGNKRRKIHIESLKKTLQIEVTTKEKITQQSTGSILRFTCAKWEYSWTFTNKKWFGSEVSMNQVLLFTLKETGPNDRLEECFMLIVT